VQEGVKLGWGKGVNIALDGIEFPTSPLGEEYLALD